MFTKVKKGKLKAFSLMDTLIALIIIGILVLIALPDHMTLITKAKSTEAKLQLEHIYSLEKDYFYTYSKYTSDMKEIGFNAPKKVEEDGTSNYNYEIANASSSDFKAVATAVVDFDADGTYNVWEINNDKKLKEVTPD